MSARPPRRAWLLAAIVLVHLLLGLAYDRATPILEASDEGSHFAVVRWLAQGHGLPVQRPGETTDWAQEGSQPPLYYMLAAALVAHIDTSDWEAVSVPNPFVRHHPGTPHNANLYRHPPAEAGPYQGTALAVHVVRWLSLAISAFTIWLTYRLARAAFPGNESVAVLAAALAAFNPMALFINASVNNDNLLMALASAALLVSLRLLCPERHAGRRLALMAGLGLLLGLAALTKVSGLVLWPIAGLAMVLGEAATDHARPSTEGGPGPQTGRGLGDWLRASFLRLVSAAPGLLITFGVALAVSGWWFWRNLRLYGELFGLNTMVAIAGPRQPPIDLFSLVSQEWWGFFASFWGVFGGFTILPAEWVFMFYGALTLVALAGGVSEVVVRRARPRAAVGLLVLYCLLTAAGVIRWTLMTPASQGRLLFGALAPLAVLLAAGLLAAARPLLRLRAGRNWAHGLSLTLSAALAVVAAVIPNGYIAPHYVPPTPLAEAGLPEDLRPVYARFGSGIELIGYTAGAEPVQPGGTLPVTLYWRALQPMRDDFALALHLLGRDAELVGKLDTWPGGGLRPTSQWQPGAIYADHYWLPVSAAASAPTLLRLQVYFWKWGTDEQLPITGGDGGPLPDLTLAAVGRAVPAHPPEARAEVALPTRFEHGIELLGYSARSRNGLELTLFWRLDGSEPVPADYTVFVHVVDDRGRAVAEPADGPPLAGYWPTSAWLPGELVVDERRVPLPASLPPGSYNVLVGWYDPHTGARLTATNSDGVRWPDDSVTLLVELP